MMQKFNGIVIDMPTGTQPGMVTEYATRAEVIPISGDPKDLDSAPADIVELFHYLSGLHPSEWPSDPVQCRRLQAAYHAAEIVMNQGTDSGRSNNAETPLEPHTLCEVIDGSGGSACPFISVSGQVTQEQRATSSRVRKTLQALTPEHRSLLESSCIDGLSPEQIAKRLNMPIAKVFGGLKLARTLFEELYSPKKPKNKS